LPRDPALTYRGALQILGHYDRPAIEKLDQILGGVILGAGIAAATAILSPALAPLAALAAVWGWLEQKNETVKLLRKIVNSTNKKLMDTSGYERRQLVAAAHTTIVVGAFLETLQEHFGPKDYKKLAITEAERKALLLGSPESRANRRLIEVLYGAPVPAPSPARGFEETIPQIEEWMAETTVSTQAFLSGLACWPSVNRPLTRFFIQDAVERYKSNYLKLAATVPEFLVWAMLGEHAATRSSVEGLREDVNAVLTGHTSALVRLENMLELIAPKESAKRDLSNIVSQANRGVLDELIVPEAVIVPAEEVIFPTVEQIFLNPRYRLSPLNDDARPSDDKWWESRPLGTDLDLLLTGYLTAPDATSAPLLLLGDPGAGKSLLTKVVAARLPTSAFTVVRVPLRRVHADAPIYQQIQQALETATNGRVNWSELAEESGSTLRVVLLDGLDELLQTAGHRGGYLQDVVDFQRREAEQQRPVAVLVTSRTVVADRVAIPPGTIMIKLEDFDEQQIESWLSVWNHVNEAAIASGTVRGLQPQGALRQPDLAKQPLLLLMLALYSADPGSPDLDSTVSSADLYRRMLDNFSRREVAKSASKLQVDEFEEAVREQLERLSVAAFAMFNRGRQDVTDDELGADLRSLGIDIPATARAVDLGRRLIGQFFFVYVAEAQPHAPQDKRRSYEFLHATFGEYLIASYVIQILADTADAATSVRHSAHDPDDQLLFALLCHQTLATRKTTLTFAAQLMKEFSPEKRDRILTVIDTLITNCRRRPSSSRYIEYHPIPIDHIRQIAAYSANLVLLRVMLDDDDTFSPAIVWGNENAWRAWRSTVVLWRSGLEPDGFQAILSILALGEAVIRPRQAQEMMPTEWVDLLQARLVSDKEAESRLRFGMAVYDRALYSEPGDIWEEVNLSTLIPAISLPGIKMPILLQKQQNQQNQHSGHLAGSGRSEVGFDGYDMATLLQMSSRLLVLKSGKLSASEVQTIIEWMLSLPDEMYKQYSYVSYGFASAISFYPELLDSIPELDDAKLYEIGAPLILDLSQSEHRSRLAALSLKIRRLHYPTAKQADYTTEMVESLLAAYRFEPPIRRTEDNIA
jgi:hypothetical protein